MLSLESRACCPWHPGHVLYKYHVVPGIQGMLYKFVPGIQGDVVVMLFVILFLPPIFNLGMQHVDIELLEMLDGVGKVECFKSCINTLQRPILTK